MTTLIQFISSFLSFMALVVFVGWVVYEMFFS